MNADRPRIIVLSKDDDEQFNWLSDGWNAQSNGTAWTAGAKRLMAKAKTAITSADNVPDAIRRLEQAGFEVTREVAPDAEVANYFEEHRN